MLLLMQVSDQVQKVSERMHDRAKRVVSAVAASSLVRWASDQVDALACCVLLPVLTHARTGCLWCGEHVEVDMIRCIRSQATCEPAAGRSRLRMRTNTMTVLSRPSLECARSIVELRWSRAHALRDQRQGPGDQGRRNAAF